MEIFRVSVKSRQQDLLPSAAACAVAEGMAWQRLCDKKTKGSPDLTILSWDKLTTLLPLKSGVVPSKVTTRRLPSCCESVPPLGQSVSHSPAKLSPVGHRKMPEPSKCPSLKLPSYELPSRSHRPFSSKLPWIAIPSAPYAASPSATAAPANARVQAGRVCAQQ